MFSKRVPLTQERRQTRSEDLVIAEWNEILVGRTAINLKSIFKLCGSMSVYTIIVPYMGFFIYRILYGFSGQVAQLV
jgi:hypothetical protein